VAEAVFQFLSMLRHAGPQKYIFDEIKTIEDNEFRFQEPVSLHIKTLINIHLMNYFCIFTARLLLHEFALVNDV